MAQKSFDYIIAGGGMAGLSLAFYLNESRLRDKKTLIIDRDAKDKNDHTWCFWEKEKSAFGEIVFREWKGFWFHGTRDFSEFLSLDDYSYKMIRAVDFYEFVFSKIEQNPNFTFLQTDIQAIENGVVKTGKGEFTAKEFIFDSFTRKAYDNPKYQNLWQHFKGWLIETERDFFNPNEPTLFDFRVEQKDECRFFYVLPFSPRKALIEFTVFSDNLLEENEYEQNLEKYITESLGVKDFKILETETGIIPMSDEPHEEFPAEKIIRIGTAGGYVKPSTGYSFQRTQRRLQNLVNSLETNSIQNQKSKIQNWKAFLDSVLLNVLLTKKHSADNVFTSLFSRNKPAQVLKFLDEDTSLIEDLRIMRTVPRTVFLQAAAEVLMKRLN
ncbi:MAG TPA: lycopene cyclase family protein [Pyrinomonadaceae bacterium]|nr:lycopene cyclase family protein [Pyrinomonadaceae bacterium]